MKIVLKDKEVELKFGVGFVRELDKLREIDNGKGIKFGAGLMLVLPMLKTLDPAALADVLLASAKATAKFKVSQSDVDNWVDEQANLEAVFDDVNEELTKSNAVKPILKR